MFPPNTDFDFDFYSLCVRFPSNSHFAFPTTNFTTSALASMVSLYNALLDSGCTHHIIRDRALFSNYVSSAISVGITNCGSLEALGTGDVKFSYPYRDRHVVFTLRGCLYAPTAPINLLSVGALVERGMSCLFSPGGITKVFFADDYSLLPELEFLATVANRLSFLSLDFAPPPPDLLQLLSQLEPSLLLLLSLWHLSRSLLFLVLNLTLCSGIGALDILAWRLLGQH
jgi:hypothetical protein